jgi:predicted nucleic acid-binding protein
VALSGGTFLIDNSAIVRTRHRAVAKALTPLFREGTAATCPVVDLEVLFSAQSPVEYERMRYRRGRAYVALPVTPEVCARAADVQAKLASKSQHRGASIPDLLIAACAEVNGATVLHYDSDYDLIASVTGQPTAWVAPRGTIS